MKWIRTYEVINSVCSFSVCIRKREYMYKRVIHQGNRGGSYFCRLARTTERATAGLSFFRPRTTCTSTWIRTHAALTSPEKWLYKTYIVRFWKNNHIHDVFFIYFPSPLICHQLQTFNYCVDHTHTSLNRLCAYVYVP